MELKSVRLMMGRSWSLMMGQTLVEAMLLVMWEERRDSKAFKIGWRGVLVYLSKVRDGKSIIVLGLRFRRIEGLRGLEVDVARFTRAARLDKH